MEDGRVAERVHRRRAERPRRRVRPVAPDLQYGRDGAELRPAREHLGGQSAGGVTADIGAPRREPAHRRRLAEPDRALQPREVARLVAAPEARQDVLRPHRRGAEHRRRAPRQHAGDRLRVQQRVLVLQRLAARLEVRLVAAIALHPVDAERDERPEPASELGDDRRLTKVERLPEERRGWIAGVAGDERRDPEHEADAARVHLPNQAGGVGDARRIERELPDARFPRVVEQHPAERDPGALQPRHVLEEVGGAADLVAPLHELELRRRRRRGAPGVLLVGAENVGSGARVEVFVQPRAADTDLGARRQRREAALRLVAELAARAAG